MLQTPDALEYPNHAGWTEPSTSHDAAVAIERNGRAEYLRQAALRELTFPHTAKEIAEILNEDINSIRPRISELKKRGLVIETGLRRHKQHVFARRI